MVLLLSICAGTATPGSRSMIEQLKFEQSNNKIQMPYTTMHWQNTGRTFKLLQQQCGSTGPGMTTTRNIGS